MQGLVEQIPSAADEVLVEAIQVFEQRIGQLLDLAARAGWLPTDGEAELVEKFEFVLEAEREFEMRCWHRDNDPALD